MRLRVKWVVLLAFSVLTALALSGASLGRQGPPGASIGGGRGLGLGLSAGSLGLSHQGEPRLESQLAQVALSARTHGAAAALETARSQKIDTDQGQVRVIVDPKADRVAASESAVNAAGGSVVAQANGLIEALVPPGALQQLAANGAVAQVRPPATPYPQAVDEGVAASNAAAWHTAGYDGTGVKVAVIDLGFYGYSALLGTALPASVTTIDHCSGQLTAPPDAGGSKHGTAVAELVHQMAPGAQLYLICVDNEIALAQAEHDAVVAGVKVINHSVGWYDTSRGDGSGDAGTPDAIVADARAHGILWVNAAGNDAQDHWSGTFTPDAGSADLNDFSGSDFTNTVTIPSGEQACIYLKWDDWPVTTEDFDLLLVAGNDESNVVAFSNSNQADFAQQPTEYLCYTNPGAAASFGIVITRFNAVGSPRFDLYYTGSDALEYATASGSIGEPASSPDVLAVGAECWQTGALETYSSQGPTIDGRTKPDLSARDSVSTETYGAADPSNQGCGTSGFTGTSASSPQVAGAAAVVLGRSPTLSVDGLEAALEQTTLVGGGLSATPDIFPRARDPLARARHDSWKDRVLVGLRRRVHGQRRRNWPRPRRRSGDFGVRRTLIVARRQHHRLHARSCDMDCDGVRFKSDSNHREWRPAVMVARRDEDRVLRRRRHQDRQCQRIESGHCSRSWRRDQLLRAGVVAERNQDRLHQARHQQLLALDCEYGWKQPVAVGHDRKLDHRWLSAAQPGVVAGWDEDRIYVRRPTLGGCA